KARGDKAVSCAEVARRWLSLSESSLTGADLAVKLMSPGGVLELVKAEHVYRVETNLQIAHAPKSATRDFRTDYLMKVFDYNAQSDAFEEATLENQFDRDRIAASAELKQDFMRWLLDTKQLAALDRGTI